MNNRLLVIEHSTSSIAAQLKCSKLEFNNQSTDVAIHSWLLRNKDLLCTASKIIITVRLGIEDAEYMGLYIGLHIRMTKELGDVRYLPILFITDDSKEEILINQISRNKEKSSLLLFTKSTYLLSAFSLDEWVFKNLPHLDEQLLIANVISNLSIQNTNDPGHQLANDWGAFRLAKFAGYNLQINKPSSLYFKYKDSLSNNEIVPNTNNNIGLYNESCKAILIDDNAASGWSETLKFIIRSKIVNPSKSASLDVITDFEEAMNYSHYINYDVVFLDIRLLKEEDRNNQIKGVNEFSGTILLKKIKEINNGIQVIIFTASNKAWNIERLLELGANGYYIKESPEFIISTSFSKDNYEELVKTIKTCLFRKPLKEIYSLSQNIKSIIENLIKSEKIERNFGISIQQYIDLANKIVDASKNENDYAMGYLTLFKCLEIINDEFISQNTNGIWEIIKSEPLKKYEFDRMSKTYIEISPVNFKNIGPTTFEKIAGLGFQKLHLNKDDISDLYFNIKRRNNFIHPADESSLTAKHKLECNKIYNYEGYLLLLKSLYKIIYAIEKVM